MCQKTISFPVSALTSRSRNRWKLDLLFFTSRGASLYISKWRRDILGKGRKREGKKKKIFKKNPEKKKKKKRRRKHKKQNVSTFSKNDAPKKKQQKKRTKREKSAPSFPNPFPADFLHQRIP